MQLGMVGLGRMGANLVRRCRRAGHECIVHDRDAATVDALVHEGAIGAHSLEELVGRLAPPRAVWLMVPAAATGAVVARLSELLTPGDTVIDGGNTHYVDDIARAAQLGARGIDLVDCGTSGGIWGLERGFCLMLGGPSGAIARLEPIFRALAPGLGAAARTPGRTGDAASEEVGYLHCGATGAGHFVKMVHNGIEYALMAAYAEGLNVLRLAGAGSDLRAADAETAPLADPTRYRYEFDVAKIAELWRRGSVVSSWLLDLAASALHASPDLASFAGRVSDSGEGRWTVAAALDEGVPVPVIATALFERFASQNRDDFANRLLSALRREFGGHEERTGTVP
jgi:6-phosphogluconate dehydrogenase